MLGFLWCCEEVGCLGLVELAGWMVDSLAGNQELLVGAGGVARRDEERLNWEQSSLF